MFISKKSAAIFLSFITVLSAAGCSDAQASAQQTAGDDRISIVCTIFPEYDWVKQIMGSSAANAEITYLLDSGIDLHNYQPSADDIIKISDCDMFIYVGGESDEWAEKAAENASNKDMKVISLLDELGGDVKTEELKEGMQGEEEEAEDGEEEEEEYDEHVWLSVKNAKVLCEKIADGLCEIDPDNAESYKADLTAYSAKLDELDGEIRAVTESAPVKTMVFGDRFPFRYFTDDYGLDYYAAFVGCSAETEASFETIVFLAEKLNELGCSTVYTIENSDKSIAETIIASSQSKNQTIAELNSLQSVSRAEIDSGATYISLMEKNCEVLKATLK